MTGATGAILTLAILLNLKLIRGAVDDGENRAVGAALCSLAQLSSSQPPAAPSATAGDTAIRAVHLLNMTLSDKAWQTSFRQKDNPDTWIEDKVPSAFENDERWKTNFRHWLQAAKDYEPEKEKEDKAENKIAKQLSPNLRKIYRAKLTALVHRLTTLSNKLKAVAAAGNSMEAKEVQQNLNLAIYGDAAGAAAPIAEEKIFSQKGSGNIGTFCDATGATAKAKTIITTIICTCASVASGSTKACWKQKTPPNQWDGSEGTSTQRWEELARRCHIPGRAKLTSAALQTALTAVIAQIEFDSSTGYLGGPGTGTCDGTKAAGICVKFAGATGPDHAAIQTNPWIAALTKAIKGLKEIEDATAATAGIEAAIEATKQEAYSLLEEVKVAVEHQVSQAQPPAVGQGTEQECNKHTEQNDCKDPCKWEANATEQTKKCSLDSKKAAEQETQAATGEKPKEGAAATGCASHFNDQTACEKMNEGKEKPVCAWKKGGEGDKKKEELRCKNGIFVNNKRIF
ncbi:Trypanosomal VSG domain containing protein [Trypanosoma brucei equiperdum]|uniref:Trypanosomal VSG domain containing protein n=1 Tax=Trypanosoma brucei equiperdum TaxID=630700 RepID=A0A3L6KSI6_9TRYP|nr:Trypanosomal VSG domain containing protein [Trypanosoma brucei equiperdum]RHW67363.1 Trypanosomal VSG domain containing protein [Trypanosoma brucei equiperdum]RHW67393.1 Trypanosomal VSG domain containing protein [Trypanosoma brucei equiperdum]RHW67404.1 Trypanosomal VSG domain containing protein [Trypanosoma brucei equiperdum]